MEKKTQFNLGYVTIAILGVLILQNIINAERGLAGWPSWHRKNAAGQSGGR